MGHKKKEWKWLCCLQQKTFHLQNCQRGFTYKHQLQTGSSNLGPWHLEAEEEKSPSQPTGLNPDVLEREREHYQPKYNQGPLLRRGLPTKPRSSIPTNLQEQKGRQWMSKWLFDSMIEVPSIGESEVFWIKMPPYCSIGRIHR